MNLLNGIRAKSFTGNVFYALVLGGFTIGATRAPNPFLGVLIFLVGVAIFVYLSNLVISKYVLKPLGSFTELAKKISENDLSTEAKFNSRDEYMILEETMNTMISNLRNILQENLEAAEQVAMAAQDMSAMSEEANLSSQEVSNTIDEIARGTEEQSRSVKQSAFAAQQMAETAQQVANEAQKASTLSLQAAERARFGGDIIRDVTSTMVQLKDSVDNSAQVVRRLGLRSTEIGKITDVIRGIARQTNLLALNAAIEAARAGEHGRGFSVVADEVRALAEQSTHSASQIVELINEIQKETKAAVAAMENGTQAVNKGAELATSANEAFSEILNVVHQTVNTVQEIAAASEEQAASSQEMTSTMEGVAAISDNNAKGSQQVAAATEQQRATMETLAQSSSKLVSMADHLTALVGRFKVIGNFQRCWRVMDCNFVDCPAYQSKEEKCWLVPNTLCHEGIPNGSVMEKRSMCHQCDVFRVNTSKKGQDTADAV